MTGEMNVNSRGKGTRRSSQQTQKPQVRNNQSTTLFGNNSPSVVPYDSNSPKIPSIFDINEQSQYKFPELPGKKENTTPKVPYMSDEMRQEYNERTIIGIYKGLSNNRITKKNSEDLVKNIHRLTYDNYKYAFRSFEAAGISLTDAVMNSPHLNTAQKQECMNYLVDLGKKTADYGNQRSDDVVPNMKELVKKYEKADLTATDKKRLTADFKKIVNRSDTLTTEIPARPNGKLDGTFKQGNTGDCWLLAGIQSLSMTQEGKAILEKSVKVDAQGNATVTLNGVGKTYKITARDLKCSNELSTGDTDIRALEIAMDRYFREELPDGMADIDGNTVSKAFELLGDPNKTQVAYGQNVQKVISYIQQTGMKGKASVTGMAGNVDPRDIDATNEKGEKVKMYNAHAYSVKGADNSYVYLINPHDTSSTIKIPIKQYLQKFNLISITDVSGLK
ncbi:hypothetical protein IJ818_05945 [bacterium]|nr:hypothetical protein [bacterium]